MFNKLFLIDGLAGTGKNDLIDFIGQKHRFTSTVVHKYTTRDHRNPEEAKKTDLIFISEEDFQDKCNNDFYDYKYANERYGFAKKDVTDALARFENVFVIIRDRNLITRISNEFSEMALIVPIFIYSDRSKKSFSVWDSVLQTVLKSNMITITSRHLIFHLTILQEIHRIHSTSQTIFF